MRVPTRVLPIRTQRWGPGVAGRTRRSAPGATGRATRAPSLPGGVDTRAAAAASGRRRRKCAAVAAASGRPRRKCAAHDARPRPLSPASPPRGRRSGARAASGTGDRGRLLVTVNARCHGKNFETEARTTTKTGKRCKRIIHRKDGPSALRDGKLLSTVPTGGHPRQHPRRAARAPDAERSPGIRPRCLRQRHWQRPKRRRRPPSGQTDAVWPRTWSGGEGPPGLHARHKAGGRRVATTSGSYTL